MIEEDMTNLLPLCLFYIHLKVVQIANIPDDHILRHPDLCFTCASKMILI